VIVSFVSDDCASSSAAVPGETMALEATGVLGLSSVAVVVVVESSMLFHL